MRVESRVWESVRRSQLESATAKDLRAQGGRRRQATLEERQTSLPSSLLFNCFDCRAQAGELLNRR